MKPFPFQSSGSLVYQVWKVWLTLGSEPLAKKYENQEELLQLHSKGFLSLQLQKPCGKCCSFLGIVSYLSSTKIYAESMSWSACWSLPSGTYHLIRQMGKKPKCGAQSHLRITSWIAVSRRMSHWQEDAAWGAPYCAVQGTSCLSAPRCCQDASAACHTSAWFALYLGFWHLMRPPSLGQTHPRTVFLCFWCR